MASPSRNIRRLRGAKLKPASFSGWWSRSGILSLQALDSGSEAGRSDAKARPCDHGARLGLESLESRRMLTVTVQPVHSFSGGTTDGATPEADLTLVGSTFYSTTSFGGTSGDGTIYSYDPSTTIETDLHNFTGSDGSEPESSLTLVGSTLYGTTTFGGASGDGTLFSYNLSTQTENTLFSFDGSDGSNPEDKLTLVGSTLYGTTTDGGANSDGTLFAYNLNTQTETVVHSFNDSDGDRPVAGLTPVGSLLYGTTEFGGTSSDGTIFGFNPSTDTETTLYSFSGSDGAKPEAVLTLVGTTLYGATISGGANDDGALFSYGTTNDVETTLYSFDAIGDDGQAPYSDLTPDGSILVGTTYTGGANDEGTVYSYNPATGVESNQSSLTDTTGGNSFAALTPFGSTFYSTATTGGISNEGTVFSVTGSFTTITVTPSGGPSSFIPGGGQISVDPSITVSSNEPDLTQATVTISPATLQTGDTLSFTSPSGSGIQGSFSGGSLVLTGNATAAQYQAALQSVTFNTTSSSSVTRTLLVGAFVGTISSNLASEQIDVGSSTSIGVSGNGGSIDDGSTITTSNNGTDFAETSLGGDSERIYIVTNAGSTPINLGTVTLTGVGAGAFTVSQPQQSSLAPGASTTFSVLFQSTDLADQDATINIAATEQTTPTPTSIAPFTFAISGESLAVPSVNLGTTSAGLPFSTITSPGVFLTPTLPTIIASLSGPGSGNFVITGAVNTPISGGWSGNVTVEFLATQSGQQTATVTTTVSNVFGSERYSIIVVATATGIAQPGEFGFASQPNIPPPALNILPKIAQPTVPTAVALGAVETPIFTPARLAALNSLFNFDSGGSGGTPAIATPIWQHFESIEDELEYKGASVSEVRRHDVVLTLALEVVPEVEGADVSDERPDPQKLPHLAALETPLPEPLAPVLDTEATSARTWSIAGAASAVLAGSVALLLYPQLLRKRPGARSLLRFNRRT